MYRTIKVRLEVEEFEQKYILAYEAVFKEEIRHCVKQMEECPFDLRYHTICFSDLIDKNNCWIVYKLALRMYKRGVSGKVSHYGKSGSWSPKAIRMEKNQITFLFGKDFPISCSTFTLKPLTNEVVKIKSNKLIRIDLLHKDIFWYAAFLIQVQENKKIK